MCYVMFVPTCTSLILYSIFLVLHHVRCTEHNIYGFVLNYIFIYIFCYNTVSFMVCLSQTFLLCDNVCANLCKFHIVLYFLVLHHVRCTEHIWICFVKLYIFCYNTIHLMSVFLKHSCCVIMFAPTCASFTLYCILGYCIM